MAPTAIDAASATTQGKPVLNIAYSLFSKLFAVERLAGVVLRVDAIDVRAGMIDQRDRLLEEQRVGVSGHRFRFRHIEFVIGHIDRGAKLLAAGFEDIELS